MTRAPRTRRAVRASRARLVRQGVVVAWLAVVWVMLWGDLSVANLLAGLVLGAVVVVLLPMPPAPFPGRVRPWRVLALLVWFLGDLVRGSLQVARLALRPRFTPRGAVIGVGLRSRSDLYLTITAQIATLIPGSLVVEANRATGVLYLHVLDVTASGGLDAVRASILSLEERVLRALASDDELEEAGFAGAAGGPGERGRRR